MSNAPDDLDAIRHDYAARTGTSLADNGIDADPSHLSSGGYHCGAQDLKAINAVGRDDYSIRQPRDRAYYDWELAHGSNWASAMDKAPDWPNGGRAAWIRYNNNLRARLGARDPALAAIRGINYTPDGTSKRRFDCLTGTETSSADTVTWHTHEEYWRDTIGQPSRQWARERLDTIVEASIRDVPVDQVITERAARKAAAQQILGGTSMELVTCTDGSGAEKSVNNLSVPANGRIVLTPGGPWSVANASNFDTTYWKNTLQLKWAEIKELCGLLAPPPVPVQATLSDGQFADFKAGVVPIVHDAAQSGAQAGAAAAIDGATIHPAVS